MKRALATVAVMMVAGCIYDPMYGGGAGYPGSGHPYPGGGYPSYPGGYPGSGYDRTFRCESSDNRTRRCRVDTSGGVRLVRRLSDSPCIQGRTWGVDRDGVWVTNGCRGEFVAGYGGDRPGYGQGSGLVRCESNDNRVRRCAANTRGGVQLVRQLSSKPCTQDRTWGHDRDSIWVSNGCRAEFATGRGSGGGHRPDPGHSQTVRCESRDDRQRRCNVQVRNEVVLIRQLSRSACIRGTSWGWDRSGIWVSGGCRGEFSVR
ncbi:DUF3011 domain-containing protein [Marilutibacter alkalisoli]|nr:DUF3011 domain-containing protein [Lysobacter alkalisoli]